MAIRTTKAAVRLILETDLTDDQLDSFIAGASLWIDNNMVSQCTAASAATLTAIEQYLSSHFATSRDARLKSGKLDDTQEAYQRDAVVSEYLKLAIALDPCGIVRGEFIPGAKLPLAYRIGEGFDDRYGGD